MTLRTFSLVSKHWHALTISYTFYGVLVELRGNRLCGAREGTSADVRLLDLLECNPSIKRCIRALRLFLNSSASAATVENFCHAIAPVEAVHLVLSRTFGDESVLPCPSSFVALRPLFSASSLRILSICTDQIPTRFLSYLCNVESLVLEGVETVAKDHGSADGHIGGWRLFKLERLKVRPAGQFLATLKRAAVEDSLSAFFERIKLCLGTD